MSPQKKPHCTRCGRVLTDPYSIAVGMGPECRGGAGRAGQQLPRPMWKVAGGRITFDGLAPAAEPPNPSPVEASMQTWARVGTQPAHWIKIFGQFSLMAACTKTLPRDAERIETESVALAGAPGRSYRRPPVHIPTCESCLRKAEQQA